MIKVEVIDFSDENYLKDKEFVFEKFSDFRMFLDKEKNDVFLEEPIGIFKKDENSKYEINNRICFIEKSFGEYHIFHTRFKLIEGFEFFNSYTYSGDLKKQFLNYRLKNRLNLINK